jgi:hypothetical protein
MVIAASNPQPLRSLGLLHHHRQGFFPGGGLSLDFI